MDLRKIGEPFEKKFIHFSNIHIAEIVKTYHNWQQLNFEYKDIPEYCYSASVDEIVKKDFSLVPSKYIEFINRDENIDFSENMEILSLTFSELLKQEATSKKNLLDVLKELGHEVKL